MAINGYNLEHLLRRYGEEYFGSSDDYLSGLSVASITPLKRTGEVDEHAFKEHVDNLIEIAKLKSLVIGGMNGEGSFLTEDNFGQLIKYSQDLKEKWSGGAPLYVIGSIFRDTVKDDGERIGVENLAELYSKNNVIDAVLLAPPLRDKMGRQELMEYFINIQKVADRPIIAYLTGQSENTKLMDIDFLVELKKRMGDNFVAVKNTQDSRDFIDAYVAKTKGQKEFLGFRLLQGNDRHIQYAFKQLMELQEKMDKTGQVSLYPVGIGTISGASNVYSIGQMTAAMYAAQREELPAYEENFTFYAEKIQDYINEQIFNEVLKGNDMFIGLREFGPKAEPLIWKGMLSRYIPQMPQTVLYPGLPPLDKEQMDKLVIKTKEIDSQKDAFASGVYISQIMKNVP